LHWPAAAGPAPTPGDLGRPGGPGEAAERYNNWVRGTSSENEGEGAQKVLNVAGMKDGEITGLLFETFAEPALIQPTLLYDFPTDISPLSKCRADDPSLAERFEVYIAGLELGNAFSELNDAEEQERRFREQVE